MSLQVQRQLQAGLHASAPTALSTTTALGGGACEASSVNVVSSWPCLAVQPISWTLVATILPLRNVLSTLQDHIAAASGSVAGISQMCDILAALCSCAHTAQVTGMVRRDCML